MIVVRAFSDRAVQLFPLPCVSSVTVGSSPGHVVAPGQLLLARGLDGPEEVSEVGTIQCGWITTKGTVRGKLRDKDVQHFSVTGEILLENLGFVNTAPTSTSNYHYLGRDYELPGGKSGHYSGVAPLGEDSTSSFSTPSLGPTWNSYTGWVDYLDPILCTRYVMHGPDGQGVVVTTLSPTKAVYRNTGAPVAYINRVYCTWFRYDSTTNAMYTVSASRPTSSNGTVVTFPNGTTCSVGSVSPISAVHGYNCNLPLSGIDAVHIGYGGNVAASVQSITDQLNSEGFMTSMWQRLHEVDHTYDAAELSYDIVAQQKYVDSTLLLAVMDLMRLKSQISSYKHLIKRLRSNQVLRDMVDAAFGRYHVQDNRWARRYQRDLKRLPKEFADSHLSWRYGLTQAYRDMHALLQGISAAIGDRSPTQRLHSRRTFVVSHEDLAVTITHVLTVEVGTLPDGPLGDHMRKIQRDKKWGIYPSVFTVWDLVKYSFVFDMFTSYVSDRVQWLDHVIDAQYFPVQYVIESEKRECSIPPALALGLGDLTGSLVVRHYKRWTSSEMPIPPLDRYVERSDGRVAWPELLSLVVQRGIQRVLK